MVKFFKHIYKEVKAEPSAEQCIIVGHYNNLYLHSSKSHGSL